MTDRIHPMYRSERRVAWVIQVLVVVGILVVLVGDLLGDGPTGPQRSDEVAAPADGPDPAGPATTTSRVSG